MLVKAVMQFRSMQLRTTTMVVKRDRAANRPSTNTCLVVCSMPANYEDSMDFRGGKNKLSAWEAHGGSISGSRGTGSISTGASVLCRYRSLLITQLL
jgi:hypothetical protein